MKSLIQTARNASRKCALGAIIVLSSGLAFAQNSIDNLAASLQGGVEVIRIDFAQALTAVPAGFSIQTPARIALDFPTFNNNSGKNLVEINQGNLRSANIVQAGERTRVVLNL